MTSVVSRNRGVKAVSAGTGPLKSRPSARSSSMTGCRMSISSRPKCPDSPACGFKPSTAMRGRARSNCRPTSMCTMRKVASKRSRVIARGTSASGRCVVTSATRSLPATSNITGSAARVRVARYSVWPLNAKPASSSVLFCTGAVTIAANSPFMQPSQARSNSAITYSALRTSSCPAITGARRGTCSTRRCPARCTAGGAEAS